MFLLIVLRAIGAGAREGAGVRACTGASGARAGGLSAELVDRGVGASPGICGGFHIWINKEVSNSTKLGAEKICASLRVRELVDFQYTKVQSWTDQSNWAAIAVFLLNLPASLMEIMFQVLMKTWKAVLKGWVYFSTRSKISINIFNVVSNWIKSVGQCDLSTNWNKRTSSNVMVPSLDSTS